MSFLRHSKSLAASVSMGLGSAGIGTVIAYTSPVIPELQLSTSEAALLAGGAAMTMFFGALGAGPIIDRYGRKTTAMFTSLPFVLGWLMVGATRNINLMQVGRLITGFCTGIINVAVPVYNAEVADPSVRGLLGSIHELFFNVGLLYTYAFGMIFRFNYLAIVCAVIPVAMAASLVIMPESPRWLVACGRRQEAFEALRWLRPSASQRVNIDLSIETELSAIEDEVRRHADENFRWAEFASPTLYKPLAIMVGLMFLQEFSGFAAIIEYTVSILASATTKDTVNDTWDPRLLTVIIGIIGVFANILSGLVVDKAGRRVMLFISAVGMTIGMAGIAVFFTFLVDFHQSSANIFQLVPTMSMIVFIFSAAIGYCPVPIYLASELFPLRARGVAGGFCVASVCLSTFLVAFSFPYLLDVFHSQGVYWIYVGFSVLSIAFVLVVPETKGRSLEDIEKIFSK